MHTNNLECGKGCAILRYVFFSICCRGKDEEWCVVVVYWLGRGLWDAAYVGRNVFIIYVCVTGWFC